jgi:hypothetical protein
MLLGGFPSFKKLSQLVSEKVSKSALFSYLSKSDFLSNNDADSKSAFSAPIRTTLLRSRF